MGVAYRLMYWLGFTPWDRVLPRELAETISGPEALPPGRVLDMGSGKGTKAVFMAVHGWDVTAVEAVPQAMKAAHEQAAKAGVKVDFKQGDVTHLEQLNLTSGYSLIFDFGCYHGLNGTERERYARGVNAVAADRSHILMMAFSKAVPPVTSGVTEAELLERFGPTWRLEWSRPSHDDGTSAMRRGAATWFYLSR